jgi:hypothetical protein
VWVWNSTITQYNRKGYEIENKDPLGRFNSGLYGYNQQLPIAVVNNARVREVLYDGFEDYDYNTNGNCATCKPHRSFNYSENILSNIDESESHTGNKSLRVAAGQHFTITAPITDTFTANNSFALRTKIDSLQYSLTTVVGRGSGIDGRYTKGSSVINRVDPTINFAGPDINGIPFSAPYSCVWTAQLQPRFSETYTFSAAVDDEMTIVLNGVTILSQTKPGFKTSTPITLNAGTLYYIFITYYNRLTKATARLYWSSPSQPYEIVPTSQLYPFAHDYESNGSVTTTTDWCTRTDSINIRGAGLTDTFSLLQSKKMLISAWVKEGGNDCKCNSYTHNNISIFYGGPNTTEAPMYPSGSIIEGWQRYESVFNIPATANKLVATFNNSTNGANVYFDDIRIQPFNANMKSFVYSSSSLRLMSELDENNYASFYEYDDDGTLTRVKKETQRGIKTITETRSGMQKMTFAEVAPPPEGPKQRVYINFSSTNFTVSKYNAVYGTPTTGVATFMNLKDTAGVTTAIGITSISTSNWLGYSGYSSNDNVSQIGQGSFFPGSSATQQVYGSNWYQYSAGARYDVSKPQLRISGLNPAKTYQLVMTSTDGTLGFDNKAVFHVAGLTNPSPIEVAGDNYIQTTGATFTLKPKADGTLEIWVNPSTAYSGDLSMLPALWILEQ